MIRSIDLSVTKFAVVKSDMTEKDTPKLPIPNAKGEERTKLHTVSEQIVGWGAISGAVTEVVVPAFLAIDIGTAGGLATFGFLIVSGRADQFVNRLAKGLKEMLP